MTALATELQKRGISIYRIALILGKNPSSSSKSLKAKVNGTWAIGFTVDELTKICAQVSEISGTPLAISDLKYQVESVKMI